MKKFIILFSFVFLLFGFAKNSLVLAEEVVDTILPVVTSYTLNGVEDNIVFNPNNSAPVEIVINADKLVKFNYIYICYESDEVCNGTTRIKEFTQTTFNTSVIKLWDGKRSPATAGVASDGIYKLKIKMVDEAGIENIVFLSPYTIEVKTVSQPITLSSIEITKKPIKLDYKIGEVLDITGLEVTGTYSDGSTKKIENITVDNITGFDSSIAITSQILTITFEGKDTTFLINISEDTISTPSPVAINLKIYSGDTVLFNSPIIVIACAESQEVDAPITVNAKCAIEQSGLSNTWTWYDANFKKDSSDPKTLGVLDELGGSSSDNANYIYWGWFSDLNYGSTAINKHMLSDGEEFLLTYNSHPLRISASKNSELVGETIVFTSEEKTNFNSDWSDLIWTPLKDVTVNLGDQSCITIVDGTCSIVLDTPGSLSAIGSKSLYVPSYPIKIEVTEKSTGGGGSIVHNKIDIDKALSYLSSKQNSDGSFGSDLYTDWAGIAFSNTNLSAKNKIINYFKNKPLDSDILTDNERHAMALMSLGINPYSGTEINYIKKIADTFDGTQFGDKDLVNDDIFAIFPLMKAGYVEEDEIIQKSILFILSKQEDNGSFGSVDMTSAFIQAIENLDNIDGLSIAKEKAEKFLENSQKEDGSLENSFSTSWVILAINSLGGDVSNWEKNNLNPNDYLFSLQQEDGGLESLDKDENSRIWATSYAIPAVLGVSWFDIMESFSKPITSSSSSSSTSEKEKVLEKNKNEEIVEENTNNNLSASIGGAFSPDISTSDIFNKIKNLFFKIFEYIGRGFYWIFSLVF